MLIKTYSLPRVERKQQREWPEEVSLSSLGFISTMSWSLEGQRSYTWCLLCSWLAVDKPCLSVTCLFTCVLLSCMCLSNSFGTIDARFEEDTEVLQILIIFLGDRTFRKRCHGVRERFMQDIFWHDFRRGDQMSHYRNATFCVHVNSTHGAKKFEYQYSNVGK